MDRNEERILFHDGLTLEEVSIELSKERDECQGIDLERTHSITRQKSLAA